MRFAPVATGPSTVAIDPENRHSECMTGMYVVAILIGMTTVVFTIGVVVQSARARRRMDEAVDRAEVELCLRNAEHLIDETETAHRLETRDSMVRERALILRRRRMLVPRPR